jgi:RNA polymerase primary sigma factor
MKTVQDYLNEIGTEVLLTAEEENTLLLQAINGDKAAIDKIICANRRFVVSVANQYQNIGLSLLELITASEQGLTNAIMESASRSLDERFIQFAVAYMRKAIEEAIDKQSALRA